MTHYSTLSRIVVDAPDETHDRVLNFWREALGLSIRQSQRFPEYHAAPLPNDGLGFLMQRLGEGPSRIHLDIHTTDKLAEVDRLTALGASPVEEAELWTVMRDPAGLLFCVVTDADLNDSNANQWP